MFAKVSHYVHKQSVLRNLFYNVISLNLIHIYHIVYELALL
jgi:hypothetical protein